VFSYSVKYGDKNIGRTVNYVSRINRMIEVETGRWKINGRKQ
jgi:hypothetical protein